MDKNKKKAIETFLKEYSQSKYTGTYIEKYSEYKVIKQSKKFDKKFYRSKYEIDSDIDPVAHYVLFGYKEGKNPNKQFSSTFYLGTYTDVKNSEANPFYHYIVHGYNEKRLPYKGYVYAEESLFVKAAKLFGKIRFMHVPLTKFRAYSKEHGISNGFKKAIKVIMERLNLVRYKYVEPTYSEDIEQSIEQFEKKPLVSIIMPTYNVEPKWLDIAIKSVENQWYTNWELCIADDCSTNQNTIDYLHNIKNEKIKIKFLKKNLHISGSSNEALTLVTGEYIVMMDHDDEITLDALYEMVKCINETDADFVYSDQDLISVKGRCYGPLFKPDYSYDMVNSQNYINHLTMVKKKLMNAVDGFQKGLEGAQDHDLFLKIFEKTQKIEHIPKVLYHWRAIETSTASSHGAKDYAQEAGRKSVENSMKRQGIDAVVENGLIGGSYRVKYKIQGNPLISIIIPFKDSPELTEQCINNIINKSTYSNYEIIGVSNNSENDETYEMMDRLKSIDDRIEFYEYNVPFNFSSINNYAVKHFAKGQYVILLNNDIEIVTEEWIENMLMFAQRETTGAVGAKLFYPNNTIQHAGIIIGIGGYAGHAHKSSPYKAAGYYGRLVIDQNISAVTGACLMIRKSTYLEIGGLDEEHFKVACNDVDFCLRLQYKGYKNVFTPYVQAYHHESITRGYEDTPEKKARYNEEISVFKDRHYEILKKGDPYYNTNLALNKENFSLKFAEKDD